MNSQAHAGAISSGEIGACDSSLYAIKMYCKLSDGSSKETFLNYASLLYKEMKRSHNAGRPTGLKLFVAYVLGDYLNQLKAAHGQAGGYAAELKRRGISKANALEYRIIAEQWAALKRRGLLSSNYDEVLIQAKALKAPRHQQPQARQVMPVVAAETSGIEWNSALQEQFQAFAQEYFRTLNRTA